MFWVLQNGLSSICGASAARRALKRSLICEPITARTIEGGNPAARSRSASARRSLVLSAAHAEPAGAGFISEPTDDPLLDAASDAATPDELPATAVASGFAELLPLAAAVSWVRE